MREKEKLLECAKIAMRNAYAPFSMFCVGAAVLTEGGIIYTGCNIENSSFGATICAERVAVFKAISEGHKKITKIAIVSSGREATYPCGMCRQVLSEFMDKDGIVIIEDNAVIKEYTLETLLPFAFELK